MAALPAILSLSRLPLAGLVWALPAAAEPLLMLMALAALTDYLDGHIARALRTRGVQVPRWGAWLDPLCDKVFSVSVLGALYLRWEVPVVMLLLLGTRELLLLPLMLAYGLVRMLRGINYDFSAALIGKLTTVVQLAAVVMLLVMPPYAAPMVITAAAVGALAAAHYGIRGIKALRGA